MSLPHILLGFLNYKPQSGYDLKQIIDQTTAHFWYCDLSQIYRALDTLTDNGWATSTEDSSNNRQRKIYTITPTGEKALQDWLAEDFEPEHARRSDLARLFFGRFGNPARTKEQLRTIRRRYEHVLSQLQAIDASVCTETETEHPLDIIHWRITIDMGIKTCQAMIAWCEQSLARLEQFQED